MINWPLVENFRFTTSLPLFTANVLQLQIYKHPRFCLPTRSVSKNRAEPMFSTISWLPISAIRSKPGHVLFACKVCDIRARHSEKSQVFHAFPPNSEISRPVIFARNVRKFLVPSLRMWHWNVKAPPYWKLEQNASSLAARAGRTACFGPGQARNTCGWVRAWLFIGKIHRQSI